MDGLKIQLQAKSKHLLIGADENVNDLIKQCKKGPRSSNVTQVKIQDYKQEYSKKNFRYT